MAGRGRDGREIVYVVAEEAAGPDASLADLIRVLWSGRWMIVFVAITFSALGIAYSLLAAEWYRSEVLLAPTEAQNGSSLASRLGGLGGLMGVAGIGVTDSDTAQSIAILKSRDLTRTFIEKHDLMPVLFADEWDSEAEEWISSDVEDRPDIRDGIEFFDEEIRRIQEDAETGLVTLRIEWTDPDSAALWARSLAEMANATMRQRALEEAERNVAYLQDELQATKVAALKESISRVLESEMQKLMLARGNAEFAFRVVDSAQVPKQRSRPKRALIVVALTLLGGFVGIVVVLVRSAFTKQSTPSGQ